MVTYFSRIVNILIRPTKTIQTIRGEGVARACKYFLLLLTIDAILSMLGGLIVLQLLFRGLLGKYTVLGYVGVCLTLPAVLAGGSISFLIVVLILHLSTLVVNKNSRIDEIVRILAYGSTPVVLSLWYPPFAGFALVWSFILIVKGFRVLKMITVGRATLILLSPIAIGTLFLVVFVRLFAS